MLGRHLVCLLEKRRDFYFNEDYFLWILSIIRSLHGTSSPLCSPFISLPPWSGSAKKLPPQGRSDP